MPKPLVVVDGRPFLLHQLELLADNGVRRAVLCVGYRGELVEQTIGYRRFGIEIEYSYDGTSPSGTLGAIRGALKVLGKKFLFLYGDTYLEVNYREVSDCWLQSGLPAMMTVFRNEGRWGPSNALYADGLVHRYDKQFETSAMVWIDAGLGGVDERVVPMVGREVTDLSYLQTTLAEQRLMCGIEVQHRFYEIGTPRALEETECHLRKVAHRVSAGPHGIGVQRDNEGR